MRFFEERCIKQTIVLNVDRVEVVGFVRANWGAVEVGVNGLLAHRDRQGWSFAVLAFHRPETRYVFAGFLTPRGLEVAREMIVSLVRSSTPDEPVIVRT